MQAELLQFMQLARQQGVRISPAESMDALQAAQAVGLDSPSLLRESMAMTLAKTIEEEAICKACFDQFFLQQNTDNQTEQNTRSAEEQTTLSDQEQLAEALASDEKTQDVLNQSEFVQALLKQDQAELDAQMAEALGTLPLKQLSFFTQKGLFTRRLLDALGEAPIRQTLAELAEDNPARQALKNVQEAMQAQAKQAIERAFELNAAGQHDQLMAELLRKTKLSAVERRHTDRLQGLIQKLARKLTQKHRKRPKQTRRGQLHMIKTLRRGIVNDGVMFDTFWRRTEKRKPQIMAVCDVSGSVSAYAKFLLMLLYYLQDVLPRTRSFAFAHDLGEITSLFQQHPVEKAIEIANWRYGGATDYGSSLDQFWDIAGQDITKQTTIIMLGDARNNYGDHRFERLLEISERCRRIIWLNPEGKHQWGSGDSEMLRYQRVCQLAHECNTLGQLEYIVDELITLTR
jgi:uncharacterized protein with von Willebrand factor type A (vWA) domain